MKRAIGIPESITGIEMTAICGMDLVIIAGKVLPALGDVGLPAQCSIKCRVEDRAFVFRSSLYSDPSERLIPGCARLGPGLVEVPPRYFTQQADRKSVE